MGSRITKNLVSQSLFRAVAAKRPAKGLIHHSDRGSQYCAHEYRKLLDQFGMTSSMSRKGNCYDNAPMESFWGTLKQELVHHRRYSTRQEAIQSITEYIEIFYNRQRRQKRLGHLSPVTYAQKFYAGQLAARKVWCPLLTSEVKYTPFHISWELSISGRISRLASVLQIW